MKKLIAAALCAVSVCAVMTGCSGRTNNNNNSSNTGTTASTTSVSKEKTTTSEKSLASRVGEGVNDVLSGGKDVIDDTISAGERVVSDVMR